VPVFRQGGVLGELEKRVGGVRGAVRLLSPLSVSVTVALTGSAVTCRGRTLETLTNFLTSIPFSLPQIKKIDRNKFPDLRHRADGALENLVAFIGYRKEIERPAKGGRR
jgi:hypothetical protein